MQIATPQNPCAAFQQACRRSSHAKPKIGTQRATCAAPLERDGRPHPWLAHSPKATPSLVHLLVVDVQHGLVDRVLVEVVLHVVLPLLGLTLQRHHIKRGDAAANGRGCQIGKLVEPQVGDRVIARGIEQVDHGADIALGLRERLGGESLDVLHLAVLTIKRASQLGRVAPLHVLERIVAEQDGFVALHDIGAGNGLQRRDDHTTDGIVERADTR